MAALSAGAAVTAGVAWACLRFRPARVAIEGSSMLPTLFPGDWTIAIEPASYRRGQVVLVEHPGRPGYEIVKRITAGPGDDVDGRALGPDEWWVQGDHEPSSTDSRHFGPVGGDALKARVLLIYWPKDRRRVLR